MTITPFEQGKALHAAGDLAGAARCYVAAVDAAPADFRALNNLGAVHEALGESAAAEDAYRRALAAAPESAPIAFNLARVLHLAGRLAEAEPLYRRAIELDPELAAAHFNLGRLLQEAAREPEAVDSLQRVVSLQPDDANAHALLGDALIAQRRPVAALEHYRAAAALAPDDTARAFDVARTLETMARHAAAAACYENSVRLDPDNEAAREGHVRALHAAGRSDDALAALAAWREHAPASPLAAHLLAALGGAPVPERASDDYVRATFDRFADDFDRALGRLGYRAPELCAAALAEAAGAQRGALAVLDAGCGTGLCAPHLRALARTLEGVDLSAGMLAYARARGGYDALAEAELTAYLAAHPGRWDAIVSADTFCYLGKLAPALAAAHAALVPGGWLVFTVEHDDSAADYRLCDHGRYAHVERYVREALAAARFAPPAVAYETLRHESGTPVAALVVTAQRPANPAASSGRSCER